MTEHADTDLSTENHDGRFMRAASRVGDLGSPFYAEERQRDVWNEASAIGFQIMLWLLPVAAVVSVWVGGAPSIPYALVMFLTTGGASWVVIRYAQGRGLDLTAAEGVKAVRWRTLLYLALLVALGAGIVRAVPDNSAAPQSFGWGAVAGGLVAVATIAGSKLRARRAAR